jgi:hypothetical protein
VCNLTCSTHPSFGCSIFLSKPSKQVIPFNELFPNTKKAPFIWRELNFLILWVGFYKDGFNGWFRAWFSWDKYLSLGIESNKKEVD